MSISGFDDVNRLQHKKASQLRDELAAEADLANRKGDDKAAKHATDQIANLDKDGLVTSAAIKEMAKEQGMDPTSLEKTLAKYDPDGDGSFTHDEFDKLTQELPAGQGAGPQAPAAPKLDPTKPSPEETKAAVDGFTSAAQQAQAKPENKGKPLSQLLATDPGLKAAAEKTYDTMNRLAAKQDVTAANQAQEDLMTALNVPAADKAAFQESFANERARRTAATADSKAEIGMNFNSNPRYDGTYNANTGMARDLKVDAQKREEYSTGSPDGLQNRLERLDKEGYKDIRMEVDADLMPSPTLAKAYDAFKGKDGSYPYGSTVKDFAAAAQNPTGEFKQALAAAGVDPAALKAALPADGTKLSQQLSYYDVQQDHMKTVAEIQKKDPNFKVSLQVDLGPFHNSMGGGVPFQPENMTAEQKAWTQGIVDKTQMIAQQAQANGVGTIELHNEPNLESCHRKDKDTPTPGFFDNNKDHPDNPDNPDALDNVARQYAYISGKAYDAIKHGPNGQLLTVDSAGTGFTAPVDPPTAEQAEKALANATPAQRQAYADAKAEYDKYNGLKDPAQAAKLGAQQKMWNILHQAGGLEPPEHNNDALRWYKQVQAAQQEFFHNTMLKTDEVNIHLYGTPQQNEELIRELGQMRKDKQLPDRAKVGEYGSQMGDPNEKAADMYDQYSNTMMALQGAGFQTTSMQAFGYDPYKGFGINAPPPPKPGTEEAKDPNYSREYAPNLQRNRITGPK